MRRKAILDSTACRRAAQLNGSLPIRRGLGVLEWENAQEGWITGQKRTIHRVTLEEKYRISPNYLGRYSKVSLISIPGKTHHLPIWSTSRSSPASWRPLKRVWQNLRSRECRLKSRRVQHCGRPAPLPAPYIGLSSIASLDLRYTRRGCPASSLGLGPLQLELGK